jgi:DNA repair exonuclease SbcCD nuclease subunit
MAVKIAFTADWHLGHIKVNSAYIAEDIRRLIFPFLKDIDILFIVGDVFDGEISMNSSDANVIINLFVNLLQECYLNNVIVRIVRGTYSHDLLQNNIIVELYRKLDIELDFAVINDITVEHIAKHDTHVLYIPDNLPFKSKSDAFKHIRKLFIANNIKTVDYVAIHGEFDHMNFGIRNLNAFSASDFEPICSKLVLAGHVHKPSKFKNVIYAGSITRLAHNEEEAKGFWIINDDAPTFIKNKDAIKFITADYTNESDFENVLLRHEAIVKQFDPERLGYLRLCISDTHIRQAIQAHHNKLYPKIRLTFKSLKNAKNEDANFLSEKIKKNRVEILEVPSSKNIAYIVCEHLRLQNIHLEIKDVENIVNRHIH